MNNNNENRKKHSFTVRYVFKKTVSDVIKHYKQTKKKKNVQTGVLGTRSAATAFSHILCCGVAQLRCP